MELHADMWGKQTGRGDRREGVVRLKEVDTGREQEEEGAGIGSKLLGVRSRQVRGSGQTGRGSRQG